MKNVKVVSIGTFENGSFGVFGLPIGGAELLRVDCPELRSIVAKAYPALADYSGFTFVSRAAAEAFAKKQEIREVELEAARIAAQPTWEQKQAEMRRQIGLPANMLPEAKFVSSKGSIGILMPGMTTAYYGAFTVNSRGEFVAQ